MLEFLATSEIASSCSASKNVTSQADGGRAHTDHENFLSLNSFLKPLNHRVLQAA